MPDSPDRQVPPPPPAGGATPIPDVSARPGQVPRRGADQRTPAALRPVPPTHAGTRDGVPTPPTPPTPSVPPVPPLASPTSSDDPTTPDKAASGRRVPSRRQPLRQSATTRDQHRHRSSAERLQRLAAKQQHAATHAEQEAANRRPAPPAGSPIQAEDDAATASAALRSQPKGPSRRSQDVRRRQERIAPPRAQRPAPVVPEPPTRKPTPPGISRIPEPPQRATAPSPTRRRPTSRILEALDAKLAADQAEQASATAARRERDEAVRRVRPALSARRPAPPPKAPTPSVTSSVPIARRTPEASRGSRPKAPGFVRTSGTPDLGDVVVPLPDPSVPPVPVIPLKPTVAEPDDVVMGGDTPVAQVSAPTEDPLAASYERLVKAAKRQAALEAALTPEVSPEVSPEPTTSVAPPSPAATPETLRTAPVDALPDGPLEDLAGTPADSNFIHTAAQVVPAEPNLDDLHEEFEQAKRDADRFFGPDDFTPHSTTGPDDEPTSFVVPTEPNQGALAMDGEPQPDTIRAEERHDDATTTSDAATEAQAEVIIPEEVTPPAGMAVVADVTDIEDAEIVPEPHVVAETDIIGTIIATDLDLIADPEAVEAVDPDTVTVDESVLDTMPVEDSAIDDALASAPARIADESEPVEPPVVEPPIEDTPPQSRGFRALTAVLILIIFALVCIAAYRMMMRPGGGMANPTPTPIVPTAQTERPGESASPSRSPKATEGSPVPALPPREPLPSDAAIPPALPGQSVTPEVMGGAGNVEIGQHTISLSRINDVNLPGLIDKPVAGENVQVQSILGDGAYVWMGSDQDNRILAVIPEPFRDALKDLQAGDRVDFVGTLTSADEPEILAPEQGRDRLIRQGAAIQVRDITVRP